MLAVDKLVDATREFIRAEVLPIDDEYDGDVHAAGGDTLRVRLQDAARGVGLLSPHGPVDCGGLGLNMSERAPVFEEAGYSLFGPMALNVNAPDEGNVHLLAHVASGAQRDVYLRPLVRGRTRSAFAMTEPSPGSGSDPAALSTRATGTRDGWLINGRKHLITGADGAGQRTAGGNLRRTAARRRRPAHRGGTGGRTPYCRRRSATFRLPRGRPGTVGLARRPLRRTWTCLPERRSCR